MDLYNWYIKSGMLCGDLCVSQGAHADKYREYREFKKMHRAFTDKTIDKLRDSEREHVYIEVKITGGSEIVVQSARGDLCLVNMDNYFYSNDARKADQYEKLKRAFPR